MRTSYKVGYAERQLQREYVARLLLNGFTAPTVIDYTKRKYGLHEQDAAQVVSYVAISLARVEGK